MPRPFRVRASTKILVWVIFAVAIPWLEPIRLLGLGAILLGLLAMGRVVSYVRLLRRSLMLFLALFLIYAWATPGDPLWPAFAPLSPTIQGVIAAVFQIARLAAMLAGLALVLASMPRDQLLAGIYSLSRPLRVLGFDPSRIAVRLWLTLDYAERAAVSLRGIRWANLDDVLRTMEPGGERIEIAVEHMGLSDWAVLCMAGLAFSGMVWW